jgi:SAM-dependent methyltransferase
MTKIELICPFCKSALEQKNRSYYCRDCLKEYPYYVVNDLVIIDFNSLNITNCECNRDGITTCEIDLKSQLPENLPENKNEGKEKVRYSRMEQLIEAEIGKGDRILDLGCAEGPYAHLFTDGNESYGFDGCSKRLLLNENNALDKGYTALIVGNGLKLPFADASFDIVICTEVIEHVTETRQLIKEINRVLKKEGKLILSTPNLVSLGNRLGMVLGKGLKFNIFGFLKNGFYPLVPWREGGITEKQCSFSSIRYPEQPLHVRFFTFESLRKFLNQCGFSVEKEVGIDMTPTRFDPFLCKILKYWADVIFVVARKRNKEMM